jgi:hypothetical protein
MFFFSWWWAPEVTRDQLGHLSGGPLDFTPPPPSVPPGHVDQRGVMITREVWETYERQRWGDWT